jgi:hypothetical protein
MNDFRPTPQQERWLAVAAHLRTSVDTPWLVERSGGWRSISLLTRCAFFVLGAIAAVLTAGICYLMHFPGPLFFAGVIVIVVAEMLIAQRRLFGGGIEEALEITGLMLIVAQVMDSIHAYDAAMFSLWVAIVLALAGARLLNALFVTLAALVLSFSLYSMARSGSSDYLSAATVTSLFCFGVAAIALAAGAKQFQRPSIDRMLDWLVIAMPVCGYIWLVQANGHGLTLALLQDGLMPILPLLLMALFAAVALVAGIRRRRHAPVLAAMLGIGCVAYELRNLTGLALELRLILWGSMALLAALGLMVFLRKPRNGITSSEVETGPGSLDLLELAGVSAITPAAAAHDKPGYQGAGGTFGGGGASGKF